MQHPDLRELFKAGACYRNMRDFEKALEVFAQARLALFCEIGECLTSLGRLDEGQIVFEEVLEASPHDTRANAGMGLISLLNGDHKAAEDAYSIVLRGAPMDVSALCGMGFAKKGAGKFEEAYLILKQVLEQDINQKMALQNLTELACQLAKTDEALLLMRKYIKNHPDDKDIANDILVLENASSLNS